MHIEEPWFLYIVKCRDNSFYVGVSKDVEERVRKHNDGAGAKFTAGRRPVELVYVEKHPNQSFASSREAQIKKWNRERKKQLIDLSPNSPKDSPFLNKHFKLDSSIAFGYRRLEKKTIVD